MKKSWINIALTTVLIIVTTVAFVKIFDLKLNQNGDNIYYFSLAKSLAQGHGYVDGFSPEVSPHTHFPPGYPFLMSLLMRTGLDSMQDMKILNGVFLVLSVVLCFFIFLHLTKRKWLSFFIALLVALNANLLGWTTIMMSEIPYMFWTSLAILLFLKAFAYEKISDLRIAHYICFLGAVFSMVFAYFVKSIGMSLLLAMCATLGIEMIRQIVLYRKNRLHYPASKFRKTTIVIGVFLVAIVSLYYVPSKIWSQRAKNAGVENNSYVGNFLQKSDGTEMKTYKDWETRILDHSEKAIKQWIPYSIFQNKSTNPNLDPISLFLGIILLGLLFWGAYKANSWLLFLYVGASIGVQLFYNETWAGMRYMVAVVPFLIFYFVYGIYTLVYQGIAMVNKKTKHNLILDLILILFIAIPLASPYKDSFARLEKQSRFKTWNYLNSSQGFVEFMEMAEWISKNTSQEKIVANRKPEVFYMYFQISWTPGYEHTGSRSNRILG